MKNDIVHVYIYTVYTCVYMYIYKGSPVDGHRLVPLGMTGTAKQIGSETGMTSVYSQLAFLWLSIRY